MWGFLKRQDMIRRRITHEQKEIPCEAAVRAQMLIGKTMILTDKFLAAQIWNFDETGFTWAIAPQYMFVGKDARRGEGQQGDLKARITAAIGGSCTGAFMPLFMILKHSKSSDIAPDQTNMTVFTQLYKRNEGFGVTDGWELNVWERELTIDGKTVTHRVNYIIQDEEEYSENDNSDVEDGDDDENGSDTDGGCDDSDHE